MKYKKENTDPAIKKRTGQTGVEANNKVRSKRFELRFTPEEWESVSERSQAAGASSVALFVRSLVLAQNHQKDLETKTEYRLRIQLLASFGKIGSNINQIARALNRMKVWNSTTEGMLQELHKLQEAMTTIARAFGVKK